jgi:hypothetical protein
MWLQQSRRLLQLGVGWTLQLPSHLRHLQQRQNQLQLWLLPPLMDPDPKQQQQQLLPWSLWQQLRLLEQKQDQQQLPLNL